MERNDELKETDIKCHYFDDIIKKKNHPDNVLIYKKLYINTLVYNISYKNSIGTKLVCIRFNKVDEFIRLYDGTGHLVLFDPEKYDAI